MICQIRVEVFVIYFKVFPPYNLSSRDANEDNKLLNSLGEGKGGGGGVTTLELQSIFNFEPLSNNMSTKTMVFTS